VVDLEYLSDTHPAAGHQFQNQSVAGFGCPKNDFINGVLFDDFPSGYYPLFIEFSDHGYIARIGQARLYVVSYEIEEGR
jgi:hypothetical protein